LECVAYLETRKQLLFSFKFKFQFKFKFESSIQNKRCYTAKTKRQVDPQV